MNNLWLWKNYFMSDFSVLAELIIIIPHKRSRQSYKNGILYSFIFYPNRHGGFKNIGNGQISFSIFYVFQFSSKTKMLPAIIAAARVYAPWIVLPFAVIVGGIGYTLEGRLSDKYTPWKKSAIGKQNLIFRNIANIIFLPNYMRYSTH